MAGTQIFQEEVNENLIDVEAGINNFTRRQEYAPVSESYTSTQPQLKFSGADCTSQVETWIDEEFGDDEEASHKMHDEANSYTALLRQQVDEYIEIVDFTPTATDSIFGDHLDEDSEDSEELEMCYEPQLWSFT